MTSVRTRSISVNLKVQRSSCSWLDVCLCHTEQFRIPVSVFDGRMKKLWGVDTSSEWTGEGNRISMLRSFPRTKMTLYYSSRTLSNSWTDPPVLTPPSG